METRNLLLFFTLITSSLFSQETKKPSRESHPQTTPTKSGEEISNWEARLELARVLSYLQKYDESIQEYQKLLQEKPQSAIARREMGAVLFYEGKTKEAIEAFSQVPNQDRDAKTWLVIAELYIKDENYPEAEKIYVDYLKKNPNDDEVRLKLSALLSWEKRYDESIAQYRIILDHRPNDIQVRRRYAQVLTWKGDDEEAIREWKKTLP